MADPVVTSLASGGSSTAATTVSFTAQPAGTLLLLSVSSDDYRLTTGTNRPENTGWTLVQAGQDFLGAYLWYKITNGSETSVIYGIGSATASSYALAAATNIDQTTPADVSAAPTHTHGGYTTPTPSIIPTTGRRLIIGSLNAMSSLAISSATLSDSYVQASIGTGPAVTSREISLIAYKIVDGGTAQTITATWDINHLCSYGTIAAFNVSSGPAPSLGVFLLEDGTPLIFETPDSVAIHE